MGRRDIELRDAMAGAWTAAKVGGDQFRQLVPVYSDRLGLAYQAMRGRKSRRTGRLVAMTAVIAAVSGAAVAVAAERFFAHRNPAETRDEAVASTTETVSAVTG